MTPDYEKAATVAAETLIKYRIGTSPVSPMHMLKNAPGVQVRTFEEMSRSFDMNRRDLIYLFGNANQDAVTTMFLDGAQRRYLVLYNRQLPSVIVDRAIAMELGHILLGHDCTRPEDVRNAEAKTFALHLMCPRALIHSLQAACIRLTTDALGSITGCYHSCLQRMRSLPPIHVPAELNRAVRDLFTPYIHAYFEFQRHASLSDGSELADMGSYMEGYEE